MSVSRTTKILGTLIRKFQTKNPVEYQQFFNEYPDLEIKLDTEQDPTILIQSEKLFLKTSYVSCELRLSTCQYFLDYSMSYWGRVHYKMTTASFNWFGFNEEMKTFIKKLLCPLLDMLHTKDFNDISFPDPFYKSK